MSDQSARLRAARAFADLSRADLAEKIGVSEATLQRRENGQQQARRSELIAIAEVCKVPITFLERGFGDGNADAILTGLAELKAALADGLQEQRDSIQGEVTEMRSVVKETHEDSQQLRQTMHQDLENVREFIRETLEALPGAEAYDEPAGPKPARVGGRRRPAQ